MRGAVGNTAKAVRAKVWFYGGAAGWHFVTLPKRFSLALKRTYGVLARPWGSLPVTVTIRSMSWRTSIFPDRKLGAYVLPLKAEVRRRLGVAQGDTVAIQLAVRES